MALYNSDKQSPANTKLNEDPRQSPANDVIPPTDEQFRDYSRREVARMFSPSAAPSPNPNDPQSIASLKLSSPFVPLETKPINNQVGMYVADLQKRLGEGDIIISSNDTDRIYCKILRQDGTTGPTKYGYVYQISALEDNQPNPRPHHGTNQFEVTVGRNPHNAVKLRMPFGCDKQGQETIVKFLKERNVDVSDLPEELTPGKTYELFANKQPQSESLHYKQVAATDQTIRIPFNGNGLPQNEGSVAKLTKDMTIERTSKPDEAVKTFQILNNRGFFDDIANLQIDPTGNITVEFLNQFPDGKAPNPAFVKNLLTELEKRGIDVPPDPTKIGTPFDNIQGHPLGVRMTLQTKQNQNFIHTQKP
jgi:hypothetical protein